jgi:hypothetical protein
VNLNSRLALDPRFRLAGSEALGGFINCTIDLYDMNWGQDGKADEYNWQTNSGATVEPTLLIGGVDAQIQVYRFTLTMDAPVGSVDQVRTVRFTINSEDADGIDIRQGQMVRVTSCEGDSALERYQYTVNSGINSPVSFKRTIECEVDMKRIVGPVG